ncbi:MAG TPA: hypothetical protein VGJ05_04025 [Fimbriiglobus sp.]
MAKSKVLFAVMLLVGIGCFREKQARPTAESDGRPTYENLTLTFSCPDAELAEKLKPFVAGWAARTRARITFEPSTAKSDVVVLSPVEFGAEAASGDFVPVPAEIRTPSHPFQWSNIYDKKVMVWGDQIQGIILGIGADVLIYRNDVFRNGRPLTAAATWEDLLQQAGSLSRDDQNRPVLPPLPADDATLLHKFHLIAAGFDRMEKQSQTSALPEVVVRQAATFHHDLNTGAPRIRSESFVAALTLMKQLQAYREPGTGDGLAGFHSGRTKLAVLSLAELGRLAASYHGHIPDHFSIAPVPGTRRCFDPVTRKLVPAKNGVNHSAYLGDAGFVMAVRKTCRNATAAFDLLAELGGPSTSLKLVADPSLGFGPWRKEQTDPARREIWNGYGLGPTQMTRLISAIQVPFAGSFVNPVYAPRGPDTAALMAALAKRVRECLTGSETPDAALAAAEDDWNKIDANYPEAERLKWRRQAVGLRAGE